MKNHTVRGFALAAFAGCACSGTFAQSSQDTTVARRKSEIRAMARQPIPARFSGIRLRAQVRGAAGHADAPTQQDIYNNGLGATQTTGFLSFATSPRVLDDAYFNRGPGAGPGPGLSGVSILQQASVGIASTGTVNPAATPDVEITWYNTYNPAAAAPAFVNTVVGGTVRGSVPPPAGGWIADTVYIVDLDLTGLTGGGITTTTEFGAIEIAIYDGPTPSTTLSTDFDVAFNGEYPNMGESRNGFYENLTGGGYLATEGLFIATGAPLPFSNTVLGLQATVDTGSCCFSDGSCALATAVTCARDNGVFGGLGTDCTTASCALPGACVLTSGCVVMSSAQCTTVAGTYKGNGTNCSDDTCRIGAGTIELYNNGPVSTGATLTNGTPAPAGFTWSENAGATGCANTNFGYSCGIVGVNLFRLADDFVVPTGETWTVTASDVYAYQTLNVGAVSPLADASFNVNIWDGPPYDPASTMVYTGTGSVSTQAFIYRTALNTSGTTRQLWKITHTLSGTGATLPAGHYYFDWQTAAANGAAHFAPPMTTKGVRGNQNRDGLQQVPVGGLPFWQFAQDVGNPYNCGEGVYFQEIPFVLRGSVSGVHNPACNASPCYANCDSSTVQPCLNVQDFTCFLNKFASADTYANCDSSTIVPVLNVQDFTCFLNRFASGCSSC